MNRRSGSTRAAFGSVKDVLRDETKRGATVFLSTHSLDIAQELSDRIGVINRGRLIGCGTLDELRQRADLNGTLEEVFLKLTEEEPAPTVATEAPLEFRL